MTNNEKQFEKIAAGLNIDDRPNAEHKQALRKQMLDACKAPSDTAAIRIQPVWSRIMKSNITKTAAAAIVFIAIIIGFQFLNGATAWAKVIKAYNNVANVHIIQKMFDKDGNADQNEYWIKKSDCLYEDYGNTIVIDNGKERLVIDKESATAQFSDSFLSYRPLDNHYLFDSINIFRDKNQKEIEFVKLDDESNEKTLVFSIKDKKNHPSNVAFEGKAWVDAASMLPLKIKVDLASEPKEKEPVSGEVIFEYGAISDDVFAMEIPEGFTELPRKQRGVMSGIVLDKNEQPVANAIVYATDRAGEFSEQITTDDSGQFTFELPPEGVGKPLWLPVLFRAFEKDKTDSVAWSIIRDPANRHKQGSGREAGGNIPYDVAHVENDGCILRSANGITLRMEPSGSITGLVTDIDGTPISNAKVQLLRCDLADKHGNAGMTGVDVHKWSGPGELGVVKTDENGQYKIANLPKLWKRTKIFIRAEAAGFAGDTTSFYAQGPIEHETIDFQLYQAKLTVSGRLLDNYGKSIAGAPIWAYVNGKCFRTCNAKTDKNGTFRIKSCPDSPDLIIKAELSHGFFRDGVRTSEYYPDVTVAIDYRNDITAYEIEMIAEKPELVLNVTVKNTGGEILKYFPLEIRGEAGAISSQWKADKKLTRRTDQNGRCTFSEVPNVKELRLILHGSNSVWNDKLTDEEKVIAESNKKYFWAEVPIEVV
ncbi:MAG: carboxypeptidase-like regulatory domain-containing protein, partial [Planctomycetota bacterium]